MNRERPEDQIELEYQAWHEYIVFLLLADKTMRLCQEAEIMAPPLVRMHAAYYLHEREIGAALLNLHRLYLQKLDAAAKARTP